MSFVVSTVENLVSSLAKLVPAVLSDLLGMAARPVVLLGQAGIAADTAASFASGGILTGLLGTISAALVGVGLFALCGPKCTPLEFLVAAPYLADGLAQLPQILLPLGGAAVPLGAYPTCRTGATAPLQILLATWAMLHALGVHNSWPRWLTSRIPTAVAALFLRFTALRLLGGDGAAAVCLLALAATSAVYCVTPRALWEALGRLVRRAFEAARALLSSAYLVLERLWPHVRAAAVWLLTRPPLVALYEHALKPLALLLDRRVLPWLLPSCTAGVALSCGLGFASFAAADPSLCSAASRGARLGGLAFCGVGAALSSLVLATRAAGLTIGAPTDPLRSPLFAIALAALSRGLAAPWSAARFAWRQLMRALRPVLEHLVWPLLRRLCEAIGQLFRLAVELPLLSIPLTVASNVLLLKLAREHSGWIYARAAPAGALLHSLLGQLLGLHAVSLREAVGSDAAFALLLMGSLQVGTFFVVHSSLRAVRQALRRASTGAELSAAELQGIAAAMSDPRQCGRCGFGPVDHRGCDSLRTHHGEVATARGGGGGHISNACPRCGWFTPSLREWPAWDGLYQTEEGRGVLRRRAWSEAAVLVRASSKALVVPYAALQFGAKLGLPAALSSALAFTYLLPWMFENLKSFSALVDPPTYRERWGGRLRRRQGAAAVEGEDDHCAASRRAASSLAGAAIEPDEALANILGAAPERLFISAGEVCPVCLDAFPDECATIAASHSAAEAAHALAALDPAVVGLRCGHALHVECAEAAVRVAELRHVRCPLCREPVTLAGSASARAFS